MKPTVNKLLIKSVLFMVASHAVIYGWFYAELRRQELPTWWWAIATFTAVLTLDIAVDIWKLIK